MSHERTYWIEKLLVQAGAAAALLVVYVLLWLPLRPADPREAISFTVSGRLGQLVVMALEVWLLAAVLSVVTLPGRVSGALVATLAGVLGLSLRSAPGRTLLWAYPGAATQTFIYLVLELLLLGVVLLVAGVIIVQVRRLAARLGAAYMRGAASPIGGNATKSLRRYELLGFVEGTTVTGELTGWRHGAPGGSAASLATSCLVGGAAFVILARSSDRGQVLFALGVGFFLGELLAHQLFPTPWLVCAWAGPALVGCFLYALAAFAVVDNSPQSWIQVPFYARALPIDWLAAGCGGSVLGYWVSSRMHEQRKLEAAEERQS